MGQKIIASWGNPAPQQWLLQGFEDRQANRTVHGASRHRLLTRPLVQHCLTHGSGTFSCAPGAKVLLLVVEPWCSDAAARNPGQTGSSGRSNEFKFAVICARNLVPAHMSARSTSYLGAVGAPGAHRRVCTFGAWSCGLNQIACLEPRVVLQVFHFPRVRPTI